MITKRYDYHPIPREQVNGRRLYATPTGDKVPSVTTILDKTKPEEAKQALLEWKKRVGKEKAQQITTEAANRGTRMHTYLENYVLDDVLKEKGSNPFSWPSHDMAKEVIDNGLVHVNEYWGTEVPLYFPQVYAGTTDACGVWKGKEAIIDFKQTNKPKKEEWIDDYKYQLVAYGLAHNELFGTNIQTGVIMMCVKPIEKDGQPGIYSTPPQYQEFILDGTEWKKYENLWWHRLEDYYNQILK